MVVGSGLLLAFVVMAIVGGLVEHDPNGFVGPSLSAPSARFWLGTTQDGQSVLAQLLVSAGGTLEVGFEAGAIATVLAVAVGVTGALVGGLVDDVLNFFTNVVLVIPGLPLVIIVAAYIRSGGLTLTILVIAFISWAGAARVLRGMALSVRNRDYVLAARAYGERTWRIVVVEMLPNLSAIIVNGFIFAVIFAVLTQAGLAFLGLGDTNAMTWGNMLYLAENDEALTSGAWWWFVPPGLCIALLGTALALVNFGLDQVLNPRLRVWRQPRRKKAVE
jgi:peptide/nickel transport system permease protein